MSYLVRLSPIFAMLGLAACSVNTAPNPAPNPVVVQQQPAVTTVPPGTTVIVPRPTY